MNDLGTIDDPFERRQLEALGDRLLAARPVPAPAFRGDLRRRLVAAPSPRRLRLRAFTCLATGLALLAFATLGAVDVGPLAPTTGPGVQAAVPAADGS